MPYLYWSAQDHQDLKTLMDWGAKHELNPDTPRTPELEVALANLKERHPELV